MDEIVILILGILAVYFLCYLLQAFSVLKCFRFFNYENKAFAFVPYASYYGLAMCLNKQKFKVLGGEVDIEYFKVWWLLSLIVNLMPIPFVAQIISVVIIIACLGTNYNLIYDYTSGYEEGTHEFLGYITIFCPIIFWIKMLSVKVPKLKGDYHA